MVYASEETEPGVGVGVGVGVGAGFGVGKGAGVGVGVVGFSIGFGVGVGAGVGVGVELPGLGFVPVVVLASVPAEPAVSEPVDPAPPQADNDSTAANVMPPKYSRDLLIIVLLNISISFLILLILWRILHSVIRSDFRRFA